MNPGHAFYRYLLNPVARCVLRSPLHRVASGNIGILHFTGRKSGRALNTPLSYTREGDLVRLLSSQNTSWWKNFRGGEKAVEFEIAGRRHPGTATLYEGDSAALREGVRKFLTALPRDAAVYRIKLGRDKTPVEASLAAAAPRLILVEIELTGASPT
jgi:hypothetical protein